MRVPREDRVNLSMLVEGMAEVEPLGGHAHALGGVAGGEVGGEEVEVFDGSGVSAEGFEDGSEGVSKFVVDAEMSDGVSGLALGGGGEELGFAGLGLERVGAVLPGVHDVELLRAGEQARGEPAGLQGWAEAVAADPEVSACFREEQLLLGGRC